MKMDKQMMIEAQLLNQQAERLQEYIENGEKQLEQIKAVLESLDAIKELKGDEEILVPVTNGIFLRATLKDKKALLINVGNSTVVEKTMAQTRKLIESQAEEIEQVMAQSNLQMQELMQKVLDFDERMKDVQGIKE